MTAIAIRLVVFDMAGTIVDHGCMAPIAALREAFEHSGVPITNAEARGPMGLHKRDHIREVLRLAGVNDRWLQRHARPWTEADVQQMYQRLVPRQAEIALEHARLIPGARACHDLLRERGIAIATTTGYPRSVAQGILDRLDAEGFSVDASCCADEVPAGRPAPWMIFRCMERLGVYPPSAVLNVGDTVPDMQAAANAGVRGIGFAESSSEMGLSVSELQELAPPEKAARVAEIRAKLLAAGATSVIASVAALPGYLEAGQFRP